MALEAPQRIAGATQPGLHLVGDEDAAGVADRRHCLGQQARRVGIDAVAGEHGVDHQRGRSDALLCQIGDGLAHAVRKGGADLGPMGGELILASIGGCFMSTLLAAIRAQEAGISEVRTEVTGTIADSPSRFSAVDLYVTADSPSRELFERLVEIADRDCNMMNTLRGELDVRVRIGATIPT